MAFRIPGARFFSPPASAAPSPGGSGEVDSFNPHPMSNGEQVVDTWLPSIVTNTGQYLSPFGFATGAHIRWACALAAGTWSFRMVLGRNSSGGIVELMLGATVLGSLDTYHASLTSMVVTEVTGVAVAGGATTLGLRVNGKNASSAGYVCRAVALGGYKT